MTVWPTEADDAVEAVVDNGLVVQGRAFVLAQADEHHLVQAALDFADKVGVWLDAANDGHVVGFERVFVEKDRDAILGRAHLYGLHGRLDGRAGVLLGDAVAFDDSLLCLGDAAGVAAHGGDEEGLEAEGLELGHETFDHKRDIGNATAADGDGDGLAGIDFGA